MSAPFTLRLVRRLRVDGIEVVAGSLLRVDALTAARLLAEHQAELAYPGDVLRLRDEFRRHKAET